MLQQFIAFFLYCTVAGSHHQDPSGSLSIDIPGDIILGGLFPVHQAAPSTENGCGKLEIQPGFQYFLAMISSLQEINNNPKILPGIRLGAKIYDTCRSQTIGADRARDLIVYTLLHNKNQSLAAVIGPLRSDVAISVTNLLRVFNIPLVSYGATSPDLSNKELYSYFLRTVPPSSFQAEALTDIMKTYGWSYVLAVYSTGNYGEKGMMMFENTAGRKKICIAAREKVPRSPSEEDYLSILNNLFQASKRRAVNVILLFCRQRDITALLKAYKKTYKIHFRPFVWLASNAWGNRDDVIFGHEEQGDGAITLNHFDAPVNTFNAFLQNLTADSYGYPWYKDFWQEVKGRSRTQAPNSNMNSNISSTDNILLRTLNITPVSAVINSVFAVAHALHNMWKITCQTPRGMCDRFQKVQREILLKYIKNVTFIDSALKVTVKFNKNGEVDGNYTVVNFRKEKSKFKYVNVGSWRGVLDQYDHIRGNLEIDVENIYFRGATRKPPDSYCSKPCKRNQISKPQKLNSNCCWECIDCKANDITINNTCVPCSLGFLADNNNTVCIRVPVIYPAWSHPVGIVLAVLSLLGLLSVACTTLFLIRNHNHQVVKAAGRELSTVLLIGLSLCYLTTAVFLTKPSKIICGLRRCLGNLSLTVCYAPILLKTNRIYRIFVGARKSTSSPSFVSPKWSILISLGIISIQVLIATLWHFSDQPKTFETYPSLAHTHLECSENTYSVAVSLLYNVFLMVSCTLYAFKTRNFPRNFNEAKYVGVSMYLTCIVSIIFMSSYLYTTDYFVRIFLICSSLIAVGTIMLVGLFGPKIWLVYSHQDLQGFHFQTSNVVACSQPMYLNPTNNQPQCSKTN